MDLIGAVAAALPTLRAEAEARMLDTFDIGFPTGGFMLVNGVEVEEIDPLFTTVGYIPPSGGSILSRPSEVGGRTSLEAKREIRIPWDSDAVPPGAVAVCMAIGALTPARMLGKSYRVGGSDGSSQGTACHLEITEELS